MRSKQSNEKILARYGGLTNDSGKFNGTIRLMPDSLKLPLTVRKPTTWAVWNDLFHADVPDEFVAAAFGVMAACPRHIFIVLTKRHLRMRELLSRINTDDAVTDAFGIPELNAYMTRNDDRFGGVDDECEYDHLIEDPPEWPLKNVCGVFSASNQIELDRGIEDLRATPLAVRGLSLEPLLGPMELSEFLSDLHLVIVGSESGSKRRETKWYWADDIKNQCQAAGVPLFLKQLDVDGKLVKLPKLDGKIWAELPCA